MKKKARLSVRESEQRISRVQRHLRERGEARRHPPGEDHHADAGTERALEPPREASRSKKTRHAGRQGEDGERFRLDVVTWTDRKTYVLYFDVAELRIWIVTLCK